MRKQTLYKANIYFPWLLKVGIRCSLLRSGSNYFCYAEIARVPNKTMAHNPQPAAGPGRAVRNAEWPEAFQCHVTTGLSHYVVTQLRYKLITTVMSFQRVEFIVKFIEGK